MSKRKLTLLINEQQIKSLKVKGIEYGVSVSGLVEILAILSELDKPLFNEVVNRYRHTLAYKE